MFTEYKYSPADISVAAAAAAKALSKNRPGANPATFAAETIAARLVAKPETYFQYGPYWWAVKVALRALGQDFGPTVDEPMLREYGAALPTYAALIAGEQFRDFYNATYFQGTAQFDLDADGDQAYILFGPDMEIRRLGAADPVALAEALRARPAAADGVLDSVEQGGADATLTPFAVKFEHDAALWTANVYASDAEAARVKVQVLERTGRIGRAIEYGRLAGEPALDSADDAPLFVDRGARTVSEMAATGLLARQG